MYVHAWRTEGSLRSPWYMEKENVTREKTRSENHTMDVLHSPPPVGPKFTQLAEPKVNLCASVQQLK